jgi:hypothetical protein
MVAAKRCFVVRNVAVDKASNAAADEPAPMPAFMDPRYRGMSRYFPQMQQPQQPQTAQRPNRPPGVVLDENKLLMVLQVDAVRLKEAPAAKTPAAKPAKQVAQAAPAQ